jgi:hypothetical protein
MTLARHDDDLHSEPTLDEALADPVIQAVMLRDGVSHADIMRITAAARARLLAAAGDVVTAFPLSGRPAEIARPYHGARLRLRARR